MRQMEGVVIWSEFEDTKRGNGQWKILSLDISKISVRVAKSEGTWLRSGSMS